MWFLYDLVRQPVLNVVLLVLFVSGFITFCSTANGADDFGPYPAPSAGHVTDLANLLDEGQRAAIEQLLASHETITGVDIRVVTIAALSDYPGTPNKNIEAFATALFNQWKIGNRQQNDGVMLLVSLKDRKARIETGAGYRHSREQAALRIVNNVLVPRFRGNNFTQGIQEGVQALINEFNGQTPARASSPAVTKPPNPAAKNRAPPYPAPVVGSRMIDQGLTFGFVVGVLILAFGGIVVVMALVGYALRGYRDGMAGRGQDPGVAGNSDASGIGFLWGMLNGSDSNNHHLDSQTPSSVDHNASSFGSDSGSSSSSGSDGGGGGSSDGGGASGSF